MKNSPSVANPASFGMSSFADLLAGRAPVPGEMPGAFDAFQHQMRAALAPFTAYECVIAENLIAIEWELVQHRRMRDAAIRRIMADAVVTAVVARRRIEHEDRLDAEFDAWIDAGKSQGDWKDKEFDLARAEREGEALFRRAAGSDPQAQRQAAGEIEALGMDLVELMGRAFSGRDPGVARHEAKIEALERRRREVRRDFEALRAVRPLEALPLAG